MNARTRSFLQFVACAAIGLLAAVAYYAGFLFQLSGGWR